MRRKNISASRRSRVRNWKEAVYVVSLGCPKNLVDTELITGALVTNGFALTMIPEEASLYLINTCAFIAPAREEAEAAIMDAVAWKKEIGNGGRIAVCGCLVQWDRDAQYPQKYPEVDLWCGLDALPDIGRHVAELFDRRSHEEKFLRSENPTFLYSERMPRLQLTLPHVAYLKIADGCNNHCAYCTIPKLRGRLRSRDVESLVNEFESLLHNGVREIIIIAQDTTAFGMDKENQHNLAQLLRHLDSFEGNFWLRLLYTHPEHYNDELIDVIAASGHIIPYLDIPMQHISDSVLQAMNRRVRAQDIENLLKKLRAKIPSLALRTTFIAGFPGESEDDFRRLLDFVAEQKFQRMGVFSYFPEDMTAAAEFENQIPRKIARERRDALMELQAKISLERNKEMLGKDIDAIVDQIHGSTAVARSFMDAPEIDNSIIIENAGNLAPGDFCKVKVKAFDEYSLTGEKA